MSLEQEVLEVLETDIGPYIRNHGGDVRLVEADNDGNVIVALTGACAGCPSADLGTKAMIEEILSKKVSGVRSVELERSASPEMMDLVAKMLRHEIELD